jgi:hypothetical protein
LAVPDLINLRSGSFIGIKDNISVKIPLVVKEEKKYRILLHGYTSNQENFIEVQIGGKAYRLNSISKYNSGFVEFDYYYFDIDLTKSNNFIRVINPNLDKILIESVGLLAIEDIPNFTDVEIHSRGVDIIQNDQYKYKVDFTNL